MDADVPFARPSSSVVLLRPADRAPEVFMVKRRPSASFGSTFAFPGGVLEESDALVHELCRGVTPAEADRRLGLASGGLDYYSAAIRELFEESGVLLAEHALSTQQLADARRALNDATLRWDEFAADNGLTLCCDELHYFSFWVTPVGLPKRYSARFFLAQIMGEQEACHDGGELTESCWMTAADILRARKMKSMKLPYVTRKTLQRVAKLDTVPELLAWAKACERQGVICDQPAFPPQQFA